MSTPAPGHERLPTRAERMGRLPFTKKHRKVLLGSGVGWALDAMDVGLISFVGAALAAEWSLDKTQQSFLLSIGFVGMAIGATLGGRLADRYGRRTVFAATMVLYGLATGASAFVTGLAVLLLLRFIVGLGLGAELPVASTLVSELSPTKIRGRMVVILEAFWAVGWIMAALLGYFVVQPFDNGWRYAFLVGLVPAFYAIYLRIGLPESPIFLERRGRTREAEAVVASFEKSAGVPTTPSRSTPAVSGAGKGQLWSPKYRRRTAGLWLVWFFVNFSYYGAFIWLPTLLVDRGFDLVRSFEYVLIITLAQLPGYALSAVLIEKWGRRPTLATMLIGSAIAAVGFGMADSVTMILVAGCAMSFFNLGAWGALYAVTPEVYPTLVRGSGAGAAAGFGRIASIVAPLSVPIFLAAFGQVGLFTIFAAAFAIAAAAAFLLPEQRGVALEA
ncbi:MFS transporter [Ornithinimicrobium sp. INDO-MA30-4]|uniref:MFS transporter n=1 Tax=Ornithinimicrobium sp. INDO-MA30-4 TaxID=2908651 RepID=UPI001F43A62E|nr:MFS transporter [Ornithinimicrobium sp. INDO-MA30-4]UJH69467.1 MFS transporter [Ornithinimicrobium sp. INDO-MA30-4]